jgi:hypothetical protein
MNLSNRQFNMIAKAVTLIFVLVLWVGIIHLAARTLD